MADVPTRDVLLHDPLTDVTRKERRMLLATSLLGVGLVKTGLVPTKIEALGVEFDKTNQQALLFLLAIVVGYFFVAFLVYAAADFLAWRRALRAHELERMDKYIQRERARQSSADDAIYQQAAEYFGPKEFSMARAVFFNMAGPVSIVRAAFEFLLPLLVGGYAVTLLWVSGVRI